MLKPNTTLSVPHNNVSDVVGRTNAVLLEDPKAKTPAVVATMDLQPTGYIGQEDALTDNDIESYYEPPTPVPSDDELYDEPSGYPSEDDLSSGVSFEEIGEAVEVLKSPLGIDEQSKTRVAQTLRKARKIAEKVEKKMNKPPKKGLRF